MPVLVHEQLYCAKVHLFLLCPGQGSLLCLGTVQNAYTSQANWTLGVKCAWVQYILPCMSAPLNVTDFVVSAYV